MFRKTLRNILVILYAMFYNIEYHFEAGDHGHGYFLQQALEATCR